MKRENGKYYLVLLFNVDIQPKKPVEGKIGIDVGVKDFITLSTGEKNQLSQPYEGFGGTRQA